MIFALYSRDGPKNVTWLCCKKDEVTPLRVMLARTEHCLLNSSFFSVDNIRHFMRLLGTYMHTPDHRCLEVSFG